jgi:hypothetical protein
LLKTDVLGSISFTKANQYSWQILLVGIGLGIANYSMGFWDNLGTSLIVQITISALIGYPLVVLASNYSVIRSRFTGKWQQVAASAILMALIGFIGTQGQKIVLSLVDASQPFTWWAPAGSYALQYYSDHDSGFRPPDLGGKQSKRNHSQKRKPKNLTRIAFPSRRARPSP